MANLPLAIPVPELGVDELERAQMLARRYHSEFVDLKNFKIQHDLFKRVPVDMMFRYSFVPLEQMGSRLAIAVSDPSKLMVLPRNRSHRLLQHAVDTVLHQQRVIERLQMDI